MHRLKFIFPILLVTLIALWAVPAMLKAMPDRYVMRLPEPFKQIGLPDDTVPLLPTVSSPVNAVELLGETAVLQTPTLAPTAEKSQTVSETTAKTAVNPPATATSPPTVTPAPPTPTPWPLPQTARLTGFQHKFQEWNNCGPATLAMALSYFGHQVSQTETAAILKPDPEDRNVSPYEMAAYVNEQTPYTAVSRVNGSLETVRRFVANDIPVIIEIGIEPPGEFRWMGWYGHYLLVVAYDDAAEQLWVYDSWFGTSEEPLKNAHPDGRLLSYADLDTYWPHFNHSYIALYQPEQADMVKAIIGDDLDDNLMWQNTLNQVQQATTSDPANAFNWFNLGTTFNALGDYQSAATAFDQARAIGLPWRMLWYQFGPYEAYYENGRYEDVILLADTTIKDRPYFEESFYYKGLALAALGEEKAARELFEQAAAFNPNFEPAIRAIDTK